MRGQVERDILDGVWDGRSLMPRPEEEEVRGIPLGQLIDECARAKKWGRGTLYNLAAFEDLREVPAGQLTASMYRTWRDEHLEGLAPNTQDRYTAQLSAVLRWAYDNELVLGVPKLPKWNLNDARERWLDEEEIWRLLDVCDGKIAYMRPIVQFLVFTGCRAGEGLWMPKRAIKNMRDRATGHGYLAAEFVTRKTGGRGKKTRLVPLHEEAVEALELAGWRQGEAMVPVFRNRDGQPWSRSNGSAGSAIAWGWNEARKRAGLEDVRVHDLRHTFATHLRIAGAQLDEIRHHLGVTEHMVQRYASLQMSNMRSALAGLPGRAGA